jgi:transcriptional regulator with XRE-family HTH domain
MATEKDPIDIHVGAKLRLRRTGVKLSQEKLAEALGITFQQVQKYENGSNRVGASRLFQVARILNVPVSYFFEGFTLPVADPTVRLMAAESQNDLTPYPQQPETGKAAPTSSREAKEINDLLAAFKAIPNPAVRKKVLDMIKSLAAGSTQA